MAYTLKIKDGNEWKTVKQVNYVTTHDYFIAAEPYATWYIGEDTHECLDCMGNPNGHWREDGWALVEFGDGPYVDTENTPIQLDVWFKYDFIDYDDTNYGGQDWTLKTSPGYVCEYIYGRESISEPGRDMPCHVQVAYVFPNHFPGELGFSSNIVTSVGFPHHFTECSPQCSDWADRGYQSYEDCMCTECNEQCS